MKAVWNAVESLFPWGICLLIGMALGKALRVFTGCSNAPSQGEVKHEQEQGFEPGLACGFGAREPDETS